MNIAEIARIDFLGQALELESCAKKVESQTAERAMLAAAATLRELAKLLNGGVS